MEDVWLGLRALPFTGLLDRVLADGAGLRGSASFSVEDFFAGLTERLLIQASIASWNLIESLIVEFFEDLTGL